MNDIMIQSMHVLQYDHHNKSPHIATKSFSCVEHFYDLFSKQLSAQYHYCHHIVYYIPSILYITSPVFIFKRKVCTF